MMSEQRVIDELERSVDALLDKIGTLLLDVDFLAKRSMLAGSIQLGSQCDTGVSSNSIVAIAYGLLPFEMQEFPSNQSDLEACQRTYDKLPEHRKTVLVDEAMHRAHLALGVKTREFGGRS